MSSNDFEDLCLKRQVESVGWTGNCVWGGETEACGGGEAWGEAV